MRTMLTLLFALVPIAAHAHHHVYTQSNDAAGNQVLVFERQHDGSLRAIERVATAGRGAGGPLGSQGALAFAADGRRLLAVNAGSNDVSVFAVERDGRLTLLEVFPTGGTMPVSVDVRDDRVYVLDAGGSGDVSTLSLDDDGGLTLLATTPLANRAAGPAQVAVSPSGDSLVVTEKATNCIDTLPLDDDGRPGTAACHPSSGTTPFGFAFAPPERDAFGRSFDRLIVSEAAGGAALASTVSSYLVADGDVEPLAPAVRTEQTAACWIALGGGGRFVYTTDAGTGVVTGLALHRDGALRLLSPDGNSASTGPSSHPIDAAVAGGNLFVLDSGTQSLSAFRIGDDGSLTAASTTSALPPAAAGLLAR